MINIGLLHFWPDSIASNDMHVRSTQIFGLDGYPVQSCCSVKGEYDFIRLQ